MRPTDTLIQLFQETDPTPKEWDANSKNDTSLPSRIAQYKRERLALEVQLDIRELLQKLVGRVR
jgi:hypothetical protein